MQQKILEDYAPFYMEQPIELREEDFTEPQHVRTFTLFGVKGNQFCVKEMPDWWYTFGYYHNGTGHYKLVLRSIESMTDEEKSEAKELFGHLGHWNTQDKVSYYPEAIMWLVKKGFDVFGLIEAGLALDKNKFDL